ncbi:hypothetical protein GCM10007108_05100 [Thermogymnomonas acidicola]|uniref:Uncharacterized protein n=1 Tax=Thermogymnomonas acidicola TaxID=399579 RepID=A0AA37F905_9ARCH|nr:hypothetical protein GCM10007108_05100 [Thermogymnomonas acidicola]
MVASAAAIPSQAEVEASAAVMAEGVHVASPLALDFNTQYGCCGISWKPFGGAIYGNTELLGGALTVNLTCLGGDLCLPGILFLDNVNGLPGQFYILYGVANSTQSNWVYVNATSSSLPFNGWSEQNMSESGPYPLYASAGSTNYIDLCISTPAGCGQAPSITVYVYVNATLGSS